MCNTLTPLELETLTDKYLKDGYYVIYQWCYSYYAFNTVPHNFSFGDDQGNYSFDQWKAFIEANHATSLDEMEWRKQSEKENFKARRLSS